MDQDLLHSPNAAHYLQHIFKYRIARNSSYSSRAFARDLKLDISQLSKVLKGQQGFSKKKAESVSKALGHSKVETDYFWSLLETRFSKSRLQKDAALQRLHYLKKNSEVKEVSSEDMNAGLSWLHFAILEAVKAAPAAIKNPQIAGLTGVSPALIKKCIDDLASWKMLAVENGYAKELSVQNHYGNQTSSATIRRLHKEFINKALNAVETQSVKKRELFSTVLRFDPEHLKEARQDIDRFKREFNLKYNSVKNKKGRIYSACFQFFDLFAESEKNEEKK